MEYLEESTITEISVCCPHWSSRSLGFETKASYGPGLSEMQYALAGSSTHVVDMLIDMAVRYDWSRGCVFVMEERSTFSALDIGGFQSNPE